MSGEVFNEIKIDNELSEKEKSAILGLKSIKVDDLKIALKKEKIKIKDNDKEISLLFSEIADAFTKYDVKFALTKSATEKDDWWNDKINLTSTLIATYKTDTPVRLKALVEDKNQNDFAYFLSVIANKLIPSEKEKVEIETFWFETMKQLQDLKAKITASSTTPAIVTTPKEWITQNIPLIPETAKVPSEKPIVVPLAPDATPVQTSTENTESITPQIETIKAEDIKIICYNNISPEAIINALEKLKTTKPDLVNKIIPLLKSGSEEDVKNIQKLLNMKRSAVDGKFGRGTLAMLILAKLKIKKTTEKTTEKNTNNIDPWFDINIPDKTNDKWFNVTISDNTNDEWFDKTITKENPVEKIKTKVPTKEVSKNINKKIASIKKETQKIQEKNIDEYWNNLVVIKKIEDLPNRKKRLDKTAYSLTIWNNEYNFYQNWICKVWGKWKTTKDVIKEINNPPTLAEEMTKYVQKNVKSGFQVAEYESDNYSIFLSGNEKYKDAIHIDTKSKKISYLWINLDFSNDYKNDITKEELFYVAAKSYALINQKANDQWKFYINNATWALHFDRLASSPLISRSDLWDRMPTVLDDYKWNWLLFLNKCQDKI